MRHLATASLLGLIACGHPQQAPVVRTPDNAIAVAQGNLEWARNAAERAAFPSDEELRLRRALSDRLIAEGEYGVAREHVDVLVRARPTWWSNHLALAQIHYYGASRIDDALADVDSCLEIAPTMLPCLALRGQLLADAGDHDAAVSAYGDVLRIQRDDPAVWEGIARSHMALGSFDDARQAATEARSLAPNDVSLRVLAAMIDERDGDLGAAEGHLLWIREHHSDERAGLTYLLRFYQRAGRTDAADAVQAELDQLGTPRTQRVLRDL